MYEGQVRPKMGAPKMFDDELEADIALFVKHMELLRIPVTKEKLKADICHFTTVHKLSYNKMPKDGPGQNLLL